MMTGPPLRSSTLLVGILISGCGEQLSDAPQTVPVSGIVTLAGQPIRGATVRYLPASDKLPGASGATDGNGRYVLFVGQNRGAVPGAYKVAIQYDTLRDGSPILEEADMERMRGEIAPALPPKYSNPERTELSVVVPESGTHEADFRLEGRPAAAGKTSSSGR